MVKVSAATRWKEAFFIWFTSHIPNVDQLLNGLDSCFSI